MPGVHVINHSQMFQYACEQRKIRRNMNPGNVYYSSVLKLLSSPVRFPNLFCMGAKRGTLVWRKNINYRCLKTKRSETNIRNYRDWNARLRILTRQVTSAVRTTKSRSLVRLGHVSAMEERRTNRILGENNLLEKAQSEDWENGRITLRWYLAR